MERYTKEQRVIIVKMHHKHGENYTETTRKVRASFDRQSAPNRMTIVKLIKKFEETGSVIDQRSRMRVRFIRTMKNITVVNESVAHNPRTSINLRNNQLLHQQLSGCIISRNADVN